MKVNFRNLKNVSLVLAMFGGLSFYSFNCAPPAFKVADNTNLSMSATGDIVPTDSGPSLDEKVVAPQALQTSEQIYESMMNLTEQRTTATATQLQEFNRRSDSFSVSPELDKVNAPMMIALTSFSGEVCNGLVKRELCEDGILAANQCTNLIRANPAGQRKYFRALNFRMTVAQNSDASYTTLVTNLTNNFIGRAPAADELALFQTYKTGFLGGAADSTAQTQNLALATCSAILSSFDIYTY